VNVVVIGGTGGLGSEVVSRLRDQGNKVIAASRRTGTDLSTGDGLWGVLQGAELVVHTAMSTTRYRKVDLDGTRRMINILRGRSDSPHLVYVSIVGCDRNPYPLYRAKYAAELVLQRSGLPVTVVRATQFHTVVAAIARVCAISPVAVLPAGMAFQPCDHRWVAEQLAAVAVASPPTGFHRVPDLAGPEQITLVEAVNLARAAAGRRPAPVITVPPIGGPLRAFAARTNLPGPDAVLGGCSYRTFLTT